MDGVRGWRGFREPRNRLLIAAAGLLGVGLLLVVLSDRRPVETVEPIAPRRVAPAAEASPPRSEPELLRNDRGRVPARPDDWLGRVEGRIVSVEEEPVDHRLRVEPMGPYRSRCRRLFGSLSLEFPLVDIEPWTGVSDVIVSLVPLDGQTVDAVPAQGVVRASSCRLEPAFQALPVGSVLELRNEDPFEHGLLWGPETNALRPVEFSQDTSTTVLSRPGIFRIRGWTCNWMRAKVVVTDTPWTTVTDESGAFSFERIPAGRYLVHLATLPPLQNTHGGVASERALRPRPNDAGVTRLGIQGGPRLELVVKPRSTTRFDHPVYYDWERDPEEALDRTRFAFPSLLAQDRLVMPE